ncbi:MAG: PH domain-containing protein [Micromonosporaceae bacterium]
MSRAKRARQPELHFRHPAAGAVAAVIALIGAVPLLAYGWYFAPVLLVPLAVAVWAWRAGTDVDARGLRVRAALLSRWVAWAEVAELGADPRGRVAAWLTSGAVLRLPAVSRADLPRLISVAPQPAPTQTGQLPG